MTRVVLDTNVVVSSMLAKAAMRRRFFDYRLLEFYRPVYRNLFFPNTPMYFVAANSEISPAPRLTMF